MFAIMRYCWVWEYRSLQRGFSYIEVRYTWVLLLLRSLQIKNPYYNFYSLGHQSCITEPSNIVSAKKKKDNNNNKFTNTIKMASHLRTFREYHKNG